jgi:hypothetical protein
MLAYDTVRWFTCHRFAHTRKDCIMTSTKAYDEVKAKQDALGHQLFELLVLDNWYGALSVALRTYPMEDNLSMEFIYHDEPDFSDTEDPLYVGGDTLEQARKLKATALGEEINDDRLKELVEALLRDELTKYNVELRWKYRIAWDGTDRILCVYPRESANT